MLIADFKQGVQMLHNEIDITGMKFGRLTAIKKIGKSDSHGALWLCQCDCGKMHEARSSYLRNGFTTSCGCYRSELNAEKARRMGEKNVRHGKSRRRSKDPLYLVWHSMKARCTYPNHISYRNYGGKGVTVCDEWQAFESFYEWAMGHGYKKGLAIDRIDSDGNYEPSNCRFVTQAENNKARKGTRWVTIDGETHTLPDWARIVGNISYRGIRYRLQHGWSEKEAIFGKTG